VPDRASGSADPPRTARGLTIRDVAIRYKVGRDKVRAWVRSGQLAAVNVASVVSAKPRWIILPSALAAFEGRRASGPAPGAPRRRKATGFDFFPD
jgi:hypothetical protein